MTAPPSRVRSSLLQVNEQCPPSKEINILLLGQTGIGKTTFINAFANYLVNDTLDKAIDDEMQVIIPSSFSFTDPETFEQKLIKINDKDNREQVTENGQSNTQQCQSFVFPIGNRNLRLIDTPGMGDTRGTEQDNRNLFEILTYISHYEHLNGICIFLKPNEERLTIAFRLCIKQVLHYLHKSASENMIFIFTNARSTFFMPGTSKKLLQGLLNDHRDKHHIEVPFSKENTFLLDNEPFHCLALHKNGIKINDDQMESYKKSWDYTVKEYQRLIAYIIQCPLHAIANTLSLNEAEQLIRKLPRPIATTLKLIQQNIQLTRDYKQHILASQISAMHRLPKNIVDIVQLRDPVLVCVSQKCSQIIDVNNEKRISYTVCQRESYLSGVIQEAISDPRISQCQVINNQTDKCTKCGCSSKNHMHITYEYNTKLIYYDLSSSKNGNKDDQSLLRAIDKRISDLQNEQENIEDTYNKLSKFLYVNAIHPFNDDILCYLQLFSREEQMKNKIGVKNDDVLTSLVTITTKYESEMSLIRKELENEKNSTDVLENEDIFKLVGNLYHLPINGQKIREQIEVLQISEDIAARRLENHVKLPAKAAESKIMCTLKDIISSTTGERF